AFHEWSLRVHSVNGGGGGEGDFFHAIEPGGFKQVHRAFDVDALVKGRFEQAGPDAGAARKVNDLVKLDATERFIETGAVGQIAVNEGEGFGQRSEIVEV